MRKKGQNSKVLKEIQIHIRYVCMWKSIARYVYVSIHCIDINHQIASQQVLTEKYKTHE